MNVHSGYMARAIELAHQASAKGEVPIGALVVAKDGRIIGEGHNQSIAESDPTAHAEIVALRAAGKHLSNYRLADCALYVTLEPCPMCLGAIFHSRIRTLYFGAKDPNGGACGSVVSLDSVQALNPHCTVHGGILAKSCSSILSDYFAQLRAKHRLVRVRLREDALRMPVGVLAKWLPNVDTLFFDDLQTSKGLRVHVWSNGGAEELAKKTLVLCIHSFGHWSWQFGVVLSTPNPEGTLVWSVDLPGQGQSDKTKTGWEFDTAFQLGVLRELIQRSSAHSVILVGQGSGGALAMHLAMQELNSVIRVVLVDPVLCHVAAVVDTKGAVPHSLRQLQTILSTTSMREDIPSALSEPYPDAGYSRGLLRWAKQAVQVAPDAGASGRAEPYPFSISVFQLASAKITKVEEFLRFWGINNAPRVLVSTAPGSWAFSSQVNASIYGL